MTGTVAVFVRIRKTLFYIVVQSRGWMSNVFESNRHGRDGAWRGGMSSTTRHERPRWAECQTHDHKDNADDEWMRF